jgi:antitoxin MazE
METEVDIRMQGNALLITPVKEPRAGWFDGYQPEADSDALASLPVDEGDEEWAW